jgi:D-alanyl-D-alanine carboxypeptidase
MVKPGFWWLLPIALALMPFPLQALPGGLAVNFIAEDVSTAGMRRAGHGNDRWSGQHQGGAERELTLRSHGDGQRVFSDVSGLLAYLRNQPYARRIAWLHRGLGIPADYARLHGLPLQPEAHELIAAGPDIYQRKQRLQTAAAAAWQAMAAAAASDGVELQLVSAFRQSTTRRASCAAKLQQGTPSTLSAGLRRARLQRTPQRRAVDLTTPGHAVLEEEFEHSAAFAWLSRRAREFGFRMSYPRGNPHGVAYEPWHWVWRGEQHDRYAVLGIQDGDTKPEDFPAGAGGAGATAAK